MEKNLDFDALKKNLMDVIQESQIKLGYTKTPIRLYYPLESLNRLLNAELSVADMEIVLREFCITITDTLGKVICSRDNTRFCFQIAEEGVAYVHEHVEETGFLREFITQISSCHCTIDDVLTVFSHYSSHVKCEKIEDNEEFDHLVYFEDGIPDAFRYCIKFECEHAIYHRFTPKDYEAFGF